MSTSMIIAIGCFAILGYFYMLYSNLIKAKNKVSEAFHSIDVQLKQRYDLIPNILKIAQKQIQHENELFSDIVKLRNSAMQLSNSDDINKKIQIDSKLSKKMSDVFLSFENYPEVKSDATMVQAMQSYNAVEGYISAARRFYNSAVLELNNAVEIFPSSLIASLCNIQKVDFFSVTEEEKKTIDASDYLK